MLEGSCLCNGIRYQIQGELGPAMVCHCSRCRKANGSAFAVNAPVASDRLQIIQGRELIREYESSPGVFRCFCERCGSPLYSRRSAADQPLRLRLGTLDSPAPIQPAAHIFVASKGNWPPILDDLPQYPERP